MPALHRSALLALGAALALCACNSDASPEAGAQTDPQASAQASAQPDRGPETPSAGADADCRTASPSNAEGRCAPRPQVCPMIYRPVCGVDGRTYPNVCHAERAGVGLAHSGVCESGPSPLGASPAPSRSQNPRQQRVKS